MLLSKRCQFHVVIAGAGPVGMLLALCLKKQGLSVALIEKNNHREKLPRAIIIHPATESLFKKLRLLALLRMGLRTSHIELYRHGKKSQTLMPQGFNKGEQHFWHLPQAWIEAYLEKRLQQLSIPIFRGQTIVKYYSGKKHVRIMSQSGPKQRHRYYAHYLVACDGGNSSLRTSAMISIEQEKYPGYFLLADAHIEWPFPLTQTRYYLTPEGYVILAPLPNNITRIICSFKTTSNKHEKIYFSPDIFFKTLTARTKLTFKLHELLWVTTAYYGHRIATKAYKNRLILAGDALHQFSPVGGSNLNAGFMDAWELARAFQSKIPNFGDYEFNHLDFCDTQKKITARLTYLLARLKPNLIFQSDKHKLSLKKLFLN